jgi:hypothetical protein
MQGILRVSLEGALAILAAKLGFEGSVSKRLGSPYRSGRSYDEEPASASGQARGRGGLESKRGGGDL